MSERSRTQVTILYGITPERSELQANNKEEMEHLLESTVANIASKEQVSHIPTTLHEMIAFCNQSKYGPYIVFGPHKHS